MPLLPAYNERTDFDLEVTLLDRDGDPLVPTEAFFSIYDGTSAALVKDWTSMATFSALGVGIAEVSADDMDIVDDANAFEERVLTVQGTYGTAKEFAEEYRFRAKNLVVIPKAGP